ncbi:Ectonucleotide pyrophosphatase/phosphodiesterase family member 6 [Armadillidium nasatum]|uniref:Ectonucleotide pyrophosphatase/phosphodiesterase family member 6 n=1 Tax=Armadillidium nasatum TaxID=96803 RepID=A0A5N5TBY2_9CRUS|nr:Ectonucleotide pyrophosphatase/phosphodiesterase family member 6 [Armadillidium nasatum]
MLFAIFIMFILWFRFRYDYVDDQPKENIPGFTKLLEEGVRAEYMSPIYPSISYPDWTSLVTGLYAESHGVVGNYFYDPSDKSNFSLFDANSTGQKKWWNAEPIWTTATKAGIRTANILWSRCDVPFDDITIDYCEPFVSIRGPEVFTNNVRKAISKLQEGYDFILVSLSFNIIVVSDHGMTTTRIGSVSRVELDDYLLTEYVENIADAGAFSNIKVKEGYVDEVYNKLKGMPGVKIFKHDEIPDEFHYKNNKFIHDIVIKADIETFILKSRSPAQLPERDDTYVYNGAHGFDPREEKMRAIFFARGPDFVEGSTISAIKNVDVYPLLAHLLQVQPLPNNGSISSVKMALKSSDDVSGGSIITKTFWPLIAIIVLKFLG